MDYSETRKDAPAAEPVAGNEMPTTQDRTKDVKSDKSSDKGDYQFSDWASI